MASKLFHTVVGFGIALGAMTAGCAAASDDTGTSSTEAAQTESATEPAADAGATTDPFCEVPWPTTKGGIRQPRPQQAQACIDPQNQCGAYPAPTGGWAKCMVPTSTGQCDFSRREVWQFCKADGDQHEWACPSGTVLATQCAASAGATQ